MKTGKEKSLSGYCAEIEQLIKERNLEAAIAIGQHILRHYPKYVEAYRLLAKSTLEQGEVGYAADLFKRVLSADPEDLESRVGLGIIYTEEQALEEALWQWERSFELAPGNSDIRAQLRQIHERLEVAEFPRIELTRGALGRLYARGGLFQQSADEFRAVSRKDPQQIDIQVALAETLWRDGKLAEAEAVCEQVLEALPNCLKANLILGHIWLHTGRAEESHGPFRVAHTLDPENQVASDLLGEASPLSKEVVLIPQLDELPMEAPKPTDLISVREERLPGEWDLETVAPEEAVAEAELPDWLTQLRAAGIEEEEPVEEESLPDWLTAFEPADVEEPVPQMAPVETTVPESEPEPEPDFEAEELPDWLSGVSADEVEEPVAEPFVEAVEEEPLVVEALPAEQLATEADEIPDWLAALELEEVEKLPAEEPPEKDVSELFAEEPIAIEEADRDVPEWLQQLRTEMDHDLADITEPGLSAIPPAEDADRFESREAPGWLQDIQEVSDQPIEAISDEDILSSTGELVEEVPDWSAALQAEEPVEAEVAEAPAEPEALDTDLWREVMREEGLEEMIEAVPAEVEGLPEEAEPAEEIPDWLTALQVEEPAEAEVAEAPVEPEAPDTDLWREVMREEGLEEMIEAVPAEVEGLPEEAELAEEVPDWLTALQVEEPVEAEVAEAPVEPEVPDTDLWREVMREEGLEEMIEAVPAEVEGLPEEAKPAEEVPDWLTALQAEEPTEPGVVEVAAEAIEPVEEVPDWLADLQAEESTEPEVVEVAAEAVEPVEEVPDWLDALQVEEPAEEVAVAGLPVEAELVEPKVIVEEAEEREPTLEEEPVSFIVASCLSRLATHPDDHQVRVALARAHRDEKRPDDALEQFEILVKSGYRIKELVPDLEGLCASYLDDVSWHQLLGDAYMRVNRLTEALNAYRSAQNALSRR